MPAILVVAGIAVLGAVIARVTWRRPTDERHSIESHQQTLDTLRSMADRRPLKERDPAAPAPSSRPSKANGGHVQTGPAAADPAGAPTRTGSARPRGARPGNGRSAPAPVPASTGRAGGEALVFGDDGRGPSAPRADGPPRISPLVPVRGLHRTRGVDRLRRRRHGGLFGRVLPVVAAVVVLGVVVGAAVALAPSHHDKLGAQHRPPRTRASGGVTHTTTKVTTPPSVQPTTSTPTTADYGAPAARYTVNVDATGACWVDATLASSGAVVWTGTLASGQSQAIATTGSLIVRLGAADNVSVNLNGVPVVFPTGYQSPFDLHFVAA